MSRNPLVDLGQYQAPNMPGQMAAIALKARENTAQRKPTKPDPHARFNTEINRMFIPVENGGALITTKTPPEMVGGSLPEGYGWNDIPQAIRDKIKLPDGVNFIGFHPARMTPIQHQAMAWFGNQREAERQADADAMQQALASNPQQNQ